MPLSLSSLIVWISCSMSGDRPETLTVHKMPRAKEVEAEQLALDE